MRLIAFHARDPSTLTEIEAALSRSQSFGWVGRPEGSAWLVGHVGAAPENRGDGVFFVEGADRLADVPTGELRRRVSSGALAGLPGDFTFAFFDGPDQASFVRSAVGTSPLFVWRGRHAVGVASRLTDLTRFMPEAPRLDPLALAVLSRLTTMPPDSRTPLQSVELLAAGHCLAWTRAGFSRHSTAWWRPPPRDPVTRAQFDAHAEQLRSLVTEGLRRELDALGRNLLGLSGGLDSTILALLAAHTLGVEFNAVSLTPPSGRELTELQARLEQLRAELKNHVRRTWEHEISPGARLALLGTAPPAVWSIAHPVLCLLPRLAADAPLRCLFGGEGCDEHLGGGPALLDWASSRKPITTLRHHPSALSRGRALAYWTRFRLRTFLGRAPLKTSHLPPGFLTPSLAREYVEYSREEQTAFRKAPGGRPYLDHRVRHSGAATVQNWEVCSGLGIRRYFPFFNRDVIELAYRADPCELTGATPKRLVRAAFREAIPSQYLGITKSRWWDPAGDLRWAHPLPPDLAGIVREDWLERPPSELPAHDALRLRVLLNIITTVRNCRSGKKWETGDVTRG